MSDHYIVGRAAPGGMQDVDLYHLIHSGRLGLIQVATAAARTPRTVKSYMYGERPIPLDVAAAVTALLNGGTYREYDRLARSIALQVRDLLQGNNAEARAIARFCRTCEPDGLCGTPECELQMARVSPFRLRGVA